MVLFISQKHIMLEIENSTKPVREVFCKQKIRLEQTKYNIHKYNENSPTVRA